MYTPYNIFNPEIKKYQTGSETDKPDPGKFKANDIVTIDGVKKVVIGWDPVAGKYKTEPLSNLKGIGIRDFSQDYTELEKALKDPEVKAALWSEYNKSKSSYKISNKGENWKNVKDADDLVDRFLKVQKAIMLTNAYFSREDIKKLDLDKNPAGRQELLESLGISLDDTDIASFQKMYEDLGDLAEDPNAPTPVRDKLQTFDWAAEGDVDPSDSRIKAGKKGKGNVSQIDAVIGDNTIFQLAKLKPVTKPQLTTETKKDEPVNFITAGKFQQPPLPRRQPKFWKQDLVSMINAGMDWASIKKYLPWAKPIDLEEPQYGLLDPTWQLQQNAGLLNQQIEGLEAFGTPQSYMANLTGAAGKASENAQRILADYDTKNAMIQNEGENRKTAVRNQEEMTNAEIATNLYDKTTIANQQFDNAQRAARNKMALAYNNGLTNKAMTQAQNLMSAPYQVLPETGGYVMFDPNLASEMVPSQSDYEIRKQRLDQILKDPAYKNIEDKESIYKMLYPDENFGYPGTRQTRRRQQQYQPSYFDMMRMMYPGTTGGDPYGYIG